MSRARRRQEQDKSEGRGEEPSPAPQSACVRVTSTRGIWIGLFVVTAGWALQMAATVPGVVAAFLSQRAAQNVSVSVAQSLMLTGFGLAILSALQNGFGALNRFFEAVLQRSAAAAKAPAAAPAPPPPAPAETVNPNAVVGRGRFKDRGYVSYADGSVEVETILGSRRFKTLDEARAFVGA